MKLKAKGYAEGEGYAEDEIKENAAAIAEDVARRVVEMTEQKRIARDELRRRIADGVNNAKTVASASHDLPATAQKRSAPRRSANRTDGLTGFADEVRRIYRNAPSKAMTTQIGAAGGFPVNQEVAEDFVEVLRNELFLTQLGAKFYNMDGTAMLTIPKATADTTAYWVGEGSTVTESEPLFGFTTLVPRAIAVRVAVPNRFLAAESMNANQHIEESGRFKIREAINRAALFGAGGGAEPVGIDTQAQITGSAITRTSLGTNGRKPVLGDIEGMIGDIEDANVRKDGTAGFLFSRRAARFFGNMKDADGNYILRNEANSAIGANILGERYATTNLIPNDDTVGTNDDNTTLFYGVWSNLAIGMSNQIEVFVDPYTLSSSLQTQITIYTYADVAVLHEEAFSIRYGARV